MTKQFRIVLLLVTLIVLGTAVYFVSVKDRRNPRSYAVTKVSFDRLPQYFPAGVFMEPDARVIDNYNTEFSDGRIWATRVYETGVGTDKIRQDYEGYLKSLSGWVVSKPYSRDVNLYLSAGKGQESLVVHVYSQPGRNRVTISYQTRK